MVRSVFVTGGSGFVGSAVIDELVKRDNRVVALANRGRIDDRGGMVRSIVGGLFADDDALEEGLRGADAVIHLVGIIMEKPRQDVTFSHIHVDGTRRVIEAATRLGVRRYIHMSALGTRANALSAYHKSKYEAEQVVQASSLDWTILRPSMIHGPGGAFMKMEAAWARGKSPPFLFMPYFGAGLIGTGGAGGIQPVYVKDVARAFVDALDMPQTIGQTYSLGGPEAMTWPQMHHAVAEAVRGRRKAVLAIPAWYARVLTKIVPAALLPFNRDQIIMSGEDNTCDMTTFEKTFGWMPTGFVEALRGYGRAL